MKPDQMRAHALSKSCLARSIGIAALLFPIFAIFIPQSAAADRETLYAKAENLISYTDDVKGLRALIAQGVDVKKPGKNSQGRTLLFSAATDGKVAMMDVLLKAGADPNAQDESGMTALRHVAWTGKNQVNVMKRLIAAKADVNIAADDDSAQAEGASTTHKTANAIETMLGTRSRKRCVQGEKRYWGVPPNTTSPSLPVNDIVIIV